VLYWEREGRLGRVAEVRVALIVSDPGGARWPSSVLLEKFLHTFVEVQAESKSFKTILASDQARSVRSGPSTGKARLCGCAPQDDRPPTGRTFTSIERFNHDNASLERAAQGE